MNWTARPQGQKYQSVCTFIHVFHGLKPFKKKKKKKKKEKILVLFGHVLFHLTTCQLSLGKLYNNKGRSLRSGVYYKN